MNWPKFNKILNILLIVIIAGYIFNFFYRLPKFDSGEKAKDFNVTLADGDSFALSQLRGRYVLLDFWGSWCGPCRKESPELTALYKETKDKTYINASGFDIVSVAIETKKENWDNARQKDGHVWKFQIGEFDRFSSPIATLYGVREIPTKYFISPEGLILMVNPTFSEIKSYLLDKEEK
ncbi:MAG: TlpA disulfide reductase family protein [Saprospiraceae bacterium]|jgi:thiol-disulfide isomerase/thioredoxin|nr:TlpA family protein disulfide reductase [Saprospiraceae bacterium]